MRRYRRIAGMSLATAAAWLLAGCEGLIIGQPTPIGSGPMGTPQPTATQIAVGANQYPTHAQPQMNPIVAQVSPPGVSYRGSPYRWLEDVHSTKTRRWITFENRRTERVLAAIPQRAWALRRLEQLRGAAALAAPPGYVVERVLYLGPDGVQLPMEIAHRQGLPRDSDEPTLLSVYRPGERLGPLLTPQVLVWLEMGGVYARAEVRDGIASVPAPHGAASFPDRTIALKDFFAAARYLIDQRYTRRGRLGIAGRGFGGMMAGAAATVGPSLFGAALPTGTWAEYQPASGNCYPATLVVTARRGGDVWPWLGYELAAALQAEQICGQPILIRIENAEGAEETPAARISREADELGFAAKWLGVPESVEGP